MKKRTHRRHAAAKRKSKNTSSVYFRYVIISTLIVIALFGIAKVYDVLNNTNVLGVFLAQEGGAPPPPPSGDNGGGGAPPQNSGQQAPQQNTAQPPPNQQQSGSSQLQQYQPPAQSGQQAPQQQNSYQPQNYQQTGGQQSAPQENQNNPGYQPGSNYNTFAPGSQGTPQGQQMGGQPTSNQQPGQQPTSEQFKQFQEQFKQDAAKNGIQFNGSLPPQFQQMQLQQTSSQNSLAGNSNQGSPNAQGRSFAQAGSFQALPPPREFPTITGKFEVQGANGQPPINLNDGTTKIQLFAQNSNFEMKARRQDGSQIPIDKDALEKINNAIQIETGAQIQQTGDRISLKRGNIEAHSNFPLSFDMSTKTFTVQTGNGEKELHVLPDEAVDKLLQNKVFSQVAGDSNQPIQLTEFQNQPVFEVPGVVKKKFFGFFPVSINKTAFVSADTGDVVNTNQNIVSKVLEAASF